MSFSLPWVLFLLPLALWPLRRRAGHPIALSSLKPWAEIPDSRRVRLLSILRILSSISCALLIVALADPQSEKDIHEELHKGVAIELLVDISSSMDQQIETTTGAVSQTRMEAAKQVVAEFIENRPEDLMGLITFARYADTLSPLTFGHRALVQLVDELEIQDRPNEDGTAYGDALALACAHLTDFQKVGEETTNRSQARQAGIESRMVILLTDGENNCGRHLPQEAAALAREWGIRLYVISLGELKPSEVMSDADQLLEDIGNGTGGGFWKISDHSALSETYRHIDELEKSDITTSTRVYTETAPVYSLFALPALFLLLIDMVLRATWLRVSEEVTA